MFYDYSFTIPANTTKETPETSIILLTYGVIHRLEIGFPKGCAGLVYLQILDGLHQLWPTNADGAFNSDDYTIPINEFHLLDRSPYRLRLSGWNLDDTYDHTLEVRIGVLPALVLQPEETFMEAFKKLLKRLRIS